MQSGGEGGWSEPGYRDLIAWQKAMDLADLVYDACLGWPADERYGLTSQTKRAAISIPANIAEGKGRGTPGDFARFLDTSYGSLCELETLLYLANRRGFIDRMTRDRLLARSTEVARLIHGPLRHLRPSSPRATHEDSPTYDHPDEP